METLQQYEEAIYQSYWDSLNGTTVNWNGDTFSPELFRNREEIVSYPGIAMFTLQQEPYDQTLSRNCNRNLYRTTIQVEVLADEKGLVSAITDHILENSILANQRINLTNSSGNEETVSRDSQPRILRRHDSEQEKYLSRLQLGYIHSFGDV